MQLEKMPNAGIFYWQGKTLLVETHFVRIEDVVRVERFFDGLKEIHLFFCKGHVHIRCFGKTDTVLAAERAAQVDSCLEDLFDSLVADLNLFRIFPVDHDIGMHISVARMTETRNVDLVFFGDLVELF